MVWMSLCVVVHILLAVSIPVCNNGTTGPIIPAKFRHGKFKVRIVLLTTNHHYGAYALPVELLSIIFDSLSLKELLVASHTSNYWRSVAHSHPSFWRDVALESASPAACDFFHARLAAGSSRTVSVSITVTPLEFIPEVRSIAFDAVASNLHRIDNLCLEIPLESDEEMYAALRHPAPRLDTLDLCILDDSQSSDALPIDLFACDAPRLRYVRLTNTHLCADRIPHVFSPLSELRYCSTEALSFPTAVFTRCPARSIDLAEDDQCFLPGEKLQSVEMTIFEGSSDLVHRLPCASIPRVSSLLWDRQSAQIILGDLRGPIQLRLDLEQDVTRLFLQYESIQTGMRRTFLGSPGQIGAAYLAPVYVAEDIVSRVETLHATSTCAGLLPAFQALSGCTRVAFSLADGDRLEPPSRALCVPRLERVELESPTPRSLDAGDLAALTLSVSFACFPPSRCCALKIPTQEELACVPDEPDSTSLAVVDALVIDSAPFVHSFHGHRVL